MSISFSVRHQDNHQVTCESADFTIQLEDGEASGAVTRYTGYLTPRSSADKQGSYRCSVLYPSGTLIISEYADITIIGM